MDLSNKNDIQMTYLSLKPTSNGLTFSVDGKDTENSDFKKSIHAIVNFVSTLTHRPMVAKIEILDKDEYFILSLNIPVLPAYIDIKDADDVALINDENFPQIAKQRIRSLNLGQTNQLIDARTAEYLNYIQHEFAGAYINCKTSGQNDIAKAIQKLPIMKSFDLSSFKFSTAGRNIYKTPQFLRVKHSDNETTQARDYYVGLQESVAEDKKDDAFWRKVSERDKEYLILDESMNFTIELLKQKYGEIEFLPPTASSNIEELPSNQ